LGRAAHSRLRPSKYRTLIVADEDELAEKRAQFLSSDGV
jgi:hypothetical protein